MFYQNTKTIHIEIIQFLLKSFSFEIHPIHLNSFHHENWPHMDVQTEKLIIYFLLLLVDFFSPNL